MEFKNPGKMPPSDKHLQNSVNGRVGWLVSEVPKKHGEKPLVFFSLDEGSILPVGACTCHVDVF